MYHDWQHPVCLTCSKQRESQASKTGKGKCSLLAHPNEGSVLRIWSQPLRAAPTYLHDLQYHGCIQSCPQSILMAYGAPRHRTTTPLLKAQLSLHGLPLHSSTAAAERPTAGLHTASRPVEVPLPLTSFLCQGKRRFCSEAERDRERAEHSGTPYTHTCRVALGRAHSRCVAPAHDAALACTHVRRCASMCTADLLGKRAVWRSRVVPQYAWVAWLSTL